MHVCLECYEIYKFSSLNKRDFDLYEECQCPRVNCGGMVVEIDELIAPTIITLNQKGYITEYCCSGHWYKTKESFKPYIKFVDKESFPPIVPDGWEIKDACVIKHKSKNEFTSTIEQYSYVAKLNQLLFQWAIDLPNNSY